MPYRLSGFNSAGNQIAVLQSAVNIPPSTPFKISVKYKALGTTGNRPFGRLDGFYSRMYVFSGASNPIVRLSTATQNLDFTGAPHIPTDFNEFIFTRDALNNVTLLVNGAQAGSAQTSSEAIAFTVLGSNNSASQARAGIELEQLSVEVDGVLVHDWFKSTLTAGDTVLPDVISGNNAAQSGAWPSDDSEWVFYESDTPPAGTTYDAGGVSAMLMSSVGGASVTASAGGASTVTLSASGGASLTAAADGASAIVMTAQGGAEVGSEITAGGVSAMTMTATGGATVTARAGGVSQFTFSASGGAALSAGASGASYAAMSATGGASLVAVAGGMSAMTMTATGGGVVNEQVVTVNRVALPAAQLLTTMVLPPVAMLQSVGIQGQYNYRRTL